MKPLHFFIILFYSITYSFAQDSDFQVEGLVTDSKQTPLPFVNISIKNTQNGTKTNALGRYELDANFGDTLLFSYLGMQSYEIEVTKGSSVINVTMQSSNIELEEVEIKARRYRTQAQLLKEYPSNKNLVKTSRGILDKEIMSGSIRIIDGNNIISIGRDFLVSLKAFVPNIVVERTEEGSVEVYLSKFAYTSNPTALFEVDGVIQELPPTYLSGDEIDRIAVLERSSAMSRYGPRGAGGVIIVNTKGQTAMDELGVDRSYENKILLDSMISEASAYDAYVSFTSSYLNPSTKIKNRKKVNEIYKNNKRENIDNPYYYLEIYDYLLSRWKNSKDAAELYNEIIDHFPNNVEALKALSYLQQQYGNYEVAASIYLKILSQKPNVAQSHRDVANAYVESGDNKEALARYTRFGTSSNHLTNLPFDAQGEDLIMTTEILNILKFHGNELLDNFNKDEVREVYEGTRLVFDWNNPSAKFEVQIINPDGYYDTWQNYLENEEQNVSSGTSRYYCKQFFIDSKIKGNWIINLNYHGNQSDYPSYLKLSLYRDYGKPNQSLKIRVYRLSEEYNKIRLVQFNQK